MKRILGMLAFSLLVSGPAYAAESGTQCDPPYDPSNIVEVLFFYPGTMKYLANGPDACRFDFGDKVKAVVKDTWLMWGGCVDATLKDIDNSLAGDLKPQWREKDTSQAATRQPPYREGS
ncbi:hypothetical protein ACTRW9_09715 [Nitrospina sp. 32_T5]|uniref:hypothetical protein n=1 Tax=unclassified Nitrospina TaxID=2638683 RepID=UPI003F957E6B